MKYLSIAILAFATVSSAAAPVYTVRSLTAPGSFTSLAYGLNNSGDSVGFAVSDDGQRLVATRFGSTPSENVDLGYLGGQLSVAYGINSSNQIAGYSSTVAGENRAVLYNFDGGPVADLGRGSAMGLNDSGQVVGMSFLADDRYFAALFHTDGNAPTNLAAFQGGFNPNIGTSYAVAINDHSEAIGVWQDGFGGNRAALFNLESKTKTIFGTLGGSTSIGQDINSHGQSVGYSTLLGDKVGRAVLFSSDDSTIRDLGSLGGNYGFANAINNVGQIVGSASTAAEENAAFVWLNGVMHNLNDLIEEDFEAQLVAATDINDFGVITALAQDSQGLYFAVILEVIDGSSVPEPTTLALVFVGLAGSALTKRRNRRYVHQKILEGEQ